MLCSYNYIFRLLLHIFYNISIYVYYRYNYRNVNSLTREEAKKMGIEMKAPGEVTLETEYEKIKSLNIFI